MNKPTLPRSTTPASLRAGGGDTPCCSPRIQGVSFSNNPTRVFTQFRVLLFLALASLTLFTACGDDGDEEKKDPAFDCRTAILGCGFGLVCNQTTGACDPAPATTTGGTTTGESCEENEDCDDGFICDEATETCIEDTTPRTCDDVTCEDGFRCNPATLQCDEIVAPKCPCEEIACSEGFTCNADACAPEPTGQEPDGCERVPCDCETDGCAEEGAVCDTDTCECVVPVCECEEFGCSNGQICNTDTCACEDPCPCEEFGCPELQVCNSDACACEEPSSGSCFTDSGCADGRFCVEGTCVDELPGCRDNDDCAGDEYCNGTFSECEKTTCDSDDDCAGNRVCDTSENANFCGVCNSNDDCEDGFVCQLGSCFEDVNNANCLGGANPRTCPPETECVAIFEDPNNPENSFGSCEPLVENCVDEFDRVQNGARVPHDVSDPRGDGTAESFTAIMCDPEDEFYRVTLNEGDGVIITITYDTADREGNMEAELLGLDRNPIVNTLFDGDQSGRLVIRLEQAPATGDYILRTRLNFGPTTNYTVNIERIEGGICVDDVYEDNDSAAVPVSVFEDSIIDATLCTADEDWFAVDPGPVPFIANLEFVSDDHVGVDLVYEGETLLSDRTEDRVKTISPDPDSFVPNGAYFIRVYPIRNRHASDYVLRFEPPPCGDQYGDNSSLAQSVEPEDLDLFTAIHCEPGFDFFTLTDVTGGPEGNGLIVNLEFETFVGNSDMTLEILNKDGGVVPASLLVDESDEGRISYVIQSLPPLIQPEPEEGEEPPEPVTDAFYVRTRLLRGSEVNYSISVETFDGPICSDDENENNDTRGTATPLLFETDVNATFCVADNDWYSFVSGEENFSVYVEFEDGSPPVGVTLFEGNVPLATDITANPVKVLQMTNDTFEPNTTYHIRVNPTDNQLQSNYTIRIQPAQ